MKTNVDSGPDRFLLKTHANLKKNSGVMLSGSQDFVSTTRTHKKMINDCN